MRLLKTFLVLVCHQGLEDELRPDFQYHTKCNQCLSDIDEDDNLHQPCLPARPGPQQHRACQAVQVLEEFHAQVSPDTKMHPSESNKFDLKIYDSTQ